MKTDRFVSFLTTRGRVVLVLTALVMVSAIAGVFQLNIQTEFSVFMPPESALLDATRRAADAFGDSEQLLVLAEVGRAADSSQDAEPAASPERSLKTVARIGADLAELKGVASAQAPVPDSLLDLEGADFADALKQLRAVSGDGILTESDGVLYATVRLLLAGEAGDADIDFGDIVDAVKDRFEEAGIPATISGEPYLEAEVFSYILRIIISIPPVAILLMLTVFRLRIGSFRATVMSLVPAIVGAAVTLGAMGWFRGGVSIVTVIVPIFVIVLGSADGLHITSHVMDSLAAGDSNPEAVAKTLRAVGVPVIMTTVTTMAGFLSLLVINSGAIRELGVAAAVGIFIAGIATWLILPAILLLQKPLRSLRGNEPATAVPGVAPGTAAGVGASAAAGVRRNMIADALARLRGWPSLVFAALLLAAFIPGALRLRANLSMIDVYRPRTEVRQAIDKTTEVLGGSIPVYVTFPADREMSPELAAAVLRLEDEAREAGLAGRSLSAYSIVRSLWENVSGREGYPDNEVMARTLVTQIRRTNPGFMGSFFAETGDDAGAAVLGRAAFFLRDLDDSTLQALSDLAARISAQTGVSLQPVGTAFVMKEMNDQIIPQQLASLGLAAALVFLLTALTQRSLLLGLASTTPIIITLVTLFGVMGYARIDLSVITGIMSGLTIGVGIDYAIHYVSLLQQARKRGEPEPSETAVKYVATPVLANALGLAIGFTAMLASPLQIHVTLSILMWVTMVTSAVLSLTFLPTITRRRRRAGPAQEAGPT